MTQKHKTKSRGKGFPAAFDGTSIAQLIIKYYQLFSGKMRLQTIAL